MAPAGRATKAPGAQHTEQAIESGSHARSTRKAQQAGQRGKARTMHHMKDATPCTTYMCYSISIEAGG